MDIYSVKVMNSHNESRDLSEFKGKVLLVVNTATGCGFTPQYEGLQKLYDKYREKGFEILDFPCNQFGNQAPGSNEEISTFCTLNYHTTFTRFAKVDVNGPAQAEIFAWLKSKKGSLLGSGIKWNFTKFLVDRSGKVFRRYGPAVTPEKIEKDIAAHV